MSTLKTLKHSSIALAVAMALTACGGGGGGGSPSTATATSPTTSASVSTPTCVGAEVLTNGVCTLPPSAGNSVPPVCISPSTIVNNVCVAPAAPIVAPTCISPQVLNSSTNTCYTPSAPAPVVAVAGPCDVTAHVYGDIKQPSNYTGAFTVPTPTQKLPAQVTKAIGFKDYYPGYIGGNGCTDRTLLARNQYVETLNRMQAAGATQTFIYNYGRWDDFSKQVWSVSPADYQIPASEVAFVVAEAAKRNIKVILAWQFTDTDKLGVNIGMGQPVTSAKLRQMLNSFHTLIVDQAKTGAQNGLGGIYIDWHAFWIPNLSSDATLREMWITEMVSISADVKKVFSGKVLYGANTSIIDPRLAAVIDQFTLSLTVPYNSISVAQNNALTVNMVKTAFLSNIQQAKADYTSQMNGSSISVPINWAVAIQSKKDYFINGWTEDGFCVNSCVQLTYVTDDSVQAIGVEAALQAIAAQTQFTTATVDFDSGYWLTDDIGPDNMGWDAYANLNNYDFPNLSQSIRNKPAEYIVKYWFGK